MRACVHVLINISSAVQPDGGVDGWVCGSVLPLPANGLVDGRFCGTGLAWSNRECLRHPDRRSVLWFFCLYARFFARETC